MTCTVSGDHNHGDRFKSPKDRVVKHPFQMGELHGL